jgi:serine/threonine-protein kinase
MHVFNEPTPAEQVAPGRVSPTMAAILRKAMAKKPADRFKSAMELFRALEVREREILNERRLDASASYVPGNELTGMFMAVPTAEQMAVRPDPAPAAPTAVYGAQPAAPQPSPPQPSAYATPTAAAQLVTYPNQATAPATQSDSTRKIIIGLIVVMLLLLIALITAGAALLLK